MRLSKNSAVSQCLLIQFPKLQFVSLLLLLSVLMMGCSAKRLPGTNEECKLRTYVDADVLGYVSTRYDRQSLVRMGIIPFDVPENFAASGDDSQHFGRSLAQKFHLELSRTGEISLIEIFDRPYWPGKYDEFFAGNATAIALAREAGYNLLLVGRMEALRNDNTITVHTKIIDLSNNVTIWSARSQMNSNARQLRRDMSNLPFSPVDDHPDSFEFPERSDALVICTVNKMFAGDGIPEEAYVEQSSPAPVVSRGTRTERRNYPGSSR